MDDMNDSVVLVQEKISHRRGPEKSPGYTRDSGTQSARVLGLNGPKGDGVTETPADNESKGKDGGDKRVSNGKQMQSHEGIERLSSMGAGRASRMSGVGGAGGGKPPPGRSDDKKVPQDAPPQSTDDEEVSKEAKGKKKSEVRGFNTIIASQTAKRNLRKEASRVKKKKLRKWTDNSLAGSTFSRPPARADEDESKINTSLPNQKNPKKFHRLEPKLNTLNIFQTNSKPRKQSAAELLVSRQVEPKRNSLDIRGDPNSKMLNRKSNHLSIKIAPSTITRLEPKRNSLNLTDPLNKKAPSQMSTQTKSAVEISETEMSSLDESIAEPQEEVHWEEVKNPSEFSDSEISSDEAADNLTDAADVDKRQLDSEWLLQDKNYHSRKTNFQGHHQEMLVIFPPGKPKENEPDFLTLMMPLYRIMTFCGRFPFKIVKGSKGKPGKLLFVRNSKEYYACFLNFLFFGTASALMTRNLWHIFTEEPPFTVYHQVLLIEFDKFWSDALLSLLWLYFLTVSNAAMLKGGEDIAQFMNRWLEALDLTGYNATHGIRRIVFIGFGLLFSLTAYDIADFMVEWGHVRGSRGFVGLLIVDWFGNRMRLTPYAYRAVEWLGLFMIIYYTACALLTLGLIMIHAWSIDQAARRFNLRLVLSLQAWISYKPVPYECRRFVSFKKLFAEHLLISSFPRMLGKTFSTIINFFLFFLITAMSFSLFGLLATTIIAKPTNNNETEVFDVSKIIEDAKSTVKVHTRLPPLIHFAKDCYMVVVAWVTGFVFLEMLNRPGATIMSGARYVQRRGFLRSQNLMERRFVASMIFAYAPRARSFVKVGFFIDRQFISKFFGIAFGIFITCVQFNPYHLHTDTNIFCDVLGGCKLTIVPRVLRNQPNVQRNTHNSFGSKPSTKDNFNKSKILKHQGSLANYSFPPCDSNGTLPVGVEEFSIQCPDSDIRQPNFFQLQGNKYFRLAPLCGDSSPRPTGELLDCFGDKVNLSVTDECGNPFIRTPDTNGVLRDPILQLSVLEPKDPKGTPEVFCCFVYSQLDSQMDSCNLPEEKRGGCRKQLGSANMSAELKVAKANFLELWKTNSEIVDLSVRREWLACLCQGVAQIPLNTPNACPEVTQISVKTTTKPTTTKPSTTTTKPSTTTIKPTTTTTKPTTTTTTPTTTTTKPTTTTTTPTTTTTKPTTTTTTPTTTKPSTTTTTLSPKPCTPKYDGCYCPQTATNHQEAFRNSKVFKSCVDNFDNKKTIHVGFIDNSGGGKGIPKFSRGDANSVCNPLKKLIDISKALNDCWGDQIKPDEYRDDCGNLRAPYPSADGTKTYPKLEPVEFTGERSKNDENSTTKVVCCWNYRELYVGGQDEYKSNCPNGDTTKSKAVCYIRLVAYQKDGTAKERAEAMANRCSSSEKPRCSDETKCVFKNRVNTAYNKYCLGELKKGKDECNYKISIY